MRKSTILITILLFMFCASNVLAVSPFEEFEAIDKGLKIEINQIFIFDSDEDLMVNAHVFNSSSGARLSNSTIECHFHFNLQNGTHQIDNGVMNYDTVGYDFEYTITKDNYIYQGVYSYLIVCQTTSGEAIGGFISVPIEVNRLGSILTIQEAIIYILLTLLVLGLFLLSLYFTIAVPYSNKVDNKGSVIQVTRTKYIKLGLFLLSYILFVWVLNVLIGVSDNFVSLTMYYGFISFLFETLNNLALPISIFVLIMMFFEIIRDANIMKAISKFGSSK